MLSSEELKRYNRHIILPEIGMGGQEKLKAAKVLVIGAGGLGCPVLLYLTAAGVGQIGIVDYDVVDESNLQRQVLFNTDDLGKSKAETAGKKLALLNPHSKFKIHNSKLTSQNAIEIFKEYDIVVDGSDNFPTRYLVNDACIMEDKILVSASIFKFEGQVSVFNLKDKKTGEKGPTYRCLFPEPPDAKDVPNCSEIGVLGVLPGMIGSIQANEVIKLITGVGEPLSGKLLVLDALTMESRIIKFQRDEKNYQIKEFIDYEDFCQMNQKSFPPGFKEITVQELKAWMDKKEKIELLDVREIFETEVCSIGGINIPMNDIPKQVDQVPLDRPVVVYCHHGMRSAMIVKFLSEEFGLNNLYNLEGGIHAWASHIDGKMAKY
jgi:molybdopterin/thiamine biosynthesis adenylyltransferase/rhodanese-related sulfurtransferase